MELIAIWGIVMLLTSTVFFLAENSMFQSVLMVIEATAIFFSAVFILISYVIVIWYSGVIEYRNDLEVAKYTYNAVMEILTLLPGHTATKSNLITMGLAFGSTGIALGYSSSYFKLRIEKGLPVQSKSSTVFATLLLIWGSMLSMSTLLQ